ncbi:MAG TPA: hypothetical protein VM166_02420 [Gemmatimonadaceae bacterium]|nr:hypothetical protein [Gemmatimonadaceae bacterium]
MSKSMTRPFTLLAVVLGCALASSPAQGQTRQQRPNRTSAPVVNAKIAGRNTKTSGIHHPTAIQRFPNPAALTVVTMSDGTKRLRRPDKKGP